MSSGIAEIASERSTVSHTLLYANNSIGARNELFWCCFRPSQLKLTYGFPGFPSVEIHITLPGMRVRLMAAVGSLLSSLSTTFAYTSIPSLSFGQKSPLADKSGNVPHFTVLGEDYAPRLMSDRVILTPPSPGNKRGAIWAAERVTATDWTVDLEFRVNGPEKAGGNLQLWYVADGSAGVTTSSIYTVGKFDGLVVVVDNHRGSAGTIRGFLNDGTKSYHNNPVVDRLVFGHCNYSYRNLGRPSKLTLTSSLDKGLEVHIDDRKCFGSEGIVLPAEYQLGLTAASSDTPDSIEIFKLLTYSEEGTVQPPPQEKQQQNRNSQQQQRQVEHQSREQPLQPEMSDTEPPDTDPSTYLTSSTQFADLHNRLQLLSHAVHNLFLELSANNAANKKRHAEILAQFKESQQSSSKSSSPSSVDSETSKTLKSLDQRLSSLESLLSSLRSDLESRSTDHQGHFAQLHERLEMAQAGITDHLPQVMGRLVRSSAPRVGSLAALVLAMQVGLAVAYVFYKRRRSMAPKKYL